MATAKVPGDQKLFERVCYMLKLKVTKFQLLTVLTVSELYLKKPTSLDHILIMSSWIISGSFPKVIAIYSENVLNKKGVSFCYHLQNEESHD